MRLNLGELMRLLDYVPKETSPDLHKKILGALVSERHFGEVVGGTRAKQWDKLEKFVKSLTEEEIEAWQTHYHSFAAQEETFALMSAESDEPIATYTHKEKEA